MKIIICSNVYPPNFIGGAELIAHQQAKELQKKGHEVIVFAGNLSQNNRYFVKKEIYEGLLVYRINLKPEDYIGDFVNFSHNDVDRQFELIVKDFKPDIVHFHNIIGLSLGMICIAKEYDAKVFMTLHDYWGFCFKNTTITYKNSICKNYSACSGCMPLIKGENNENIPIIMRKAFFNIAMSYVDCFISPSRYLADIYIKAGFPKHKFKVIWNGLNVKRFSEINRGVDGKNIRFSFIGYMGSHKGIDVLIKALSHIKQSIIVNLVGEGDGLEAYKKKTKALPKNVKVKFWGKIDNSRIEEVFQETDVYVLPSIWPENQPVSITEAMASRIPVIASRIGGIPELIEDGKSGYLVSFGSAERLVKAMMNFILHPQKIEIFGKNAYEKIKNNNIENRINDILSLYEKDFSKKKENFSDRLVVCVGKYINKACSGAINAIFNKNEGVQFVMSDWLGENEFKGVALCFVTDEKVLMKDLTEIIRKNIPLIVPEANSNLKNLCTKFNCGLYYKSSIEAKLCLELLLKNESLRKRMSVNMANLLNVL